MGLFWTCSVLICAAFGEGGMRMSRKLGSKSSGMSGRVTIWLDEGVAMVVALVKMAEQSCFMKVVNASLESR